MSARNFDAIASRVTDAVTAALTATGIRRRRAPSGELEPRAWGRLATVFVTLLALLAGWTSLHVVAPGTVGIPVTLRRPAKPLRAGLHVTWPFTSVSTMTARTQNYSMTSHQNEGARANTDD